MATIKKYNGSTWENAVVRKYGTASDIITPPTTIYADGTAISTYTIKGNTMQNGTPTPSNPVTVQGVGEKSANLFDITAFYNSVVTINGNGLKSFDGETISITSVEAQDAYTKPFSGDTGTYMVTIKPNTTYTITMHTTNQPRIMLFENGLVVSGYMHDNVVSGTSITTHSDTTFLTFRMGTAMTAELGTTVQINHVMLAEGSQPLAYEPYGQYKIPILTAQGSAVNYLGSVQSYREIKKIEYTGAADESWTIVNEGTANAYVQNSGNPAANQGVDKVICSHYEAGEIYNGNTDTGILVVSNGGVRIREDNAASMSVSSFKTFLQQQYAAGTPVTVWYVLATAETAAVNEPLMKIGTYADTLSNAAQIPTTDGANSITVDTTVQPSEFTATWTGWHDSSVKEYDGSDWQ